MKEIILFAILSTIVGIISFLWANGITNMHENHPDYKGEDFLNWDDNKTHTEDEI